MNDLIMIVIRFLLYLDLMVIFGLPFFQIYGISGGGGIPETVRFLV